MIRKIVSILMSVFILMDFSKVCAVKIDGVEFIEIFKIGDFIRYGIEKKGDHFEATIIFTRIGLGKTEIRSPRGNDIMVTSVMHDKKQIKLFNNNGLLIIPKAVVENSNVTFLVAEFKGNNLAMISCSEFYGDLRRVIPSNKFLTYGLLRKTTVPIVSACTNRGCFSLVEYRGVQYLIRFDKYYKAILLRYIDGNESTLIPEMSIPIFCEESSNSICANDNGSLRDKSYDMEVIVEGVEGQSKLPGQIDDKNSKYLVMNKENHLEACISETNEDINCDVLVIVIRRNVIFEGRQVNVTAIRARALSTNAKELRAFIPATIESIGTDSFQTDMNLNGVLYIVFEPKSILRLINRSAFGFREICDFKLPSSVEDIRQYAFSVRAGSSIEIPENTQLIKIPNGSFRYSSIKEIYIPQKIKAIEKFAFGDSKMLIRVEFSKDSCLKEIGESAFSNTSSLEYIIIPKSVEKIGENAFFHSGLKDLEFQSDSCLVTIGKEAFALCERLRQVIIPESVREISNKAFFSTGICKVFASRSTPIREDLEQVVVWMD